MDKSILGTHYHRIPEQMRGAPLGFFRADHAGLGKKSFQLRNPINVSGRPDDLERGMRLAQPFHYRQKFFFFPFP